MWEDQTYLAHDNLAGIEKNEEEEGEEDAASAHGCLSHYGRDCAPAGVQKAPSWARPAADCRCGSSSLWPLYQVAFALRGFWDRVKWGGGMGKKGVGRREVGKGEVNQPQAQYLPRISKNVPLERSHTRHGKNQCAPSHTYARLIYIHKQVTNGFLRTVGACHRLLGSPRLI